jgi:hypothetical protein
VGSKVKQYRITTDNLNQDSEEDCVLDPSDPINEIKTIKYLAGLGSSAKLHEYRVDQGSNISVTGNEKGELMKKNNIRPGTPEWFQLWFSLPYMTGEKPVGK